jgi:hypothetical protein
VKQFFIAFILALGVVTGANAATFYVAKTGSDSYSCTQAQNSSTAKLTINAGMACVGTSSGAGANHVVEVATGTYTQSIGPSFPSGTSWSSPFTLRSKPGDKVTVNASNANNLSIFLPTGSSFYAIIQGFVFDGTNLGSNPSVAIGSCCDGPNSIRLLNNEFINNTYNSLSINIFSSYIEVVGNKFHGGSWLIPGGSGGDYAYPIYVGANNVLIERNEFYDFKSWGIHGYSQAGQLSNNIVRNNYFHDFGSGDSRSSAILFYNGTGNQIYNNLIVNGSSGIQVGPSANNTKVYNNTIYSARVSGIDVSGTNTVIRNNIAYQTGASISNSGTGSIISNNLTTDPKFVNSSTNDFHLQSGSSARDGGLSLLPEAITTDFEGGTRPQGCCYDIGAYEYGSAPVVATAIAPSSAPASPVPGVTVDSTYEGFSTFSIDDEVINAAGDTASTWASEASQNDHWVNIAFATPQQINTATVFWAFNNFQKKFMTANRVEVQYWDGLAFKNIGTIAYPGSDVSSSSVSFPTVTTSQLRFFMPAGQGNPSYPNILWLTEVDYGRKVVTVDSTFGGFSTAGIDDGIINASGEVATTWASEASQSDHWVEIAFASSMQINTATIHWAYNNYQQRFMTAKQLNVQYWEGSAYKTAASLAYPGSDVPSSSVVFPAVTTSRIRFFMPAGQGNPAYPSILWLTEVDYGFGNVVTTPAAPGTLIVSK